MVRRTALMCIATITVLASRTVHAEQSLVAVHGTASPHAREVVASAFASALGVAAWSLADAPTGREVAIAKCGEKASPWKCIAPLVKRKGIDRVVIVTVDRDGANDTNLTLVAMLVVAGSNEPARSREFCQTCTDQLLDQTTRGLALAIIENARRFARTTLAITTDPPGAAISVDGEPRGTSPAIVDTAPGEHRVVVDQPGYRSTTRTVELAAGQETTLLVALTAETPASPTRARWPWLVVGAGAAAIVAGTVMSLTTDPPPRTEPQPKYLYSKPGIGLAVAGGLAIVAGIYLWRRSASPTSTPTVTIGPDGGSLGWATAF